MKNLINISFVFALLLTPFTWASSDWINGQWISQGKLSYAPALNNYVENHFLISPNEFYWIRVVGRHNEKDRYEYDISEDGNIRLFGDGYVMEGQITNKGTYNERDKRTCNE